MCLFIIGEQSKTGRLCDGAQQPTGCGIPWRDLHECERRIMAFPIYVLTLPMLETRCNVDNIIMTVVTTISKGAHLQTLIASTTLFYVFLKATKVSFLDAGQRP
jgi:hypothetical protein